jgi:beta-1,4-mannosyl-glycoprotein beta-1,4-N-acetylglucosaminyltransferase
MDEERILNKIKAVSDVENLSAYKNLSTKEIRNKIASKQDLYDRERVLSDQEQNQIPQEVLSAIKKYLPYCG